MNTVEELNRIKIANMIINRGSQRLGVKPVYVGGLINLERKNKPVDELKLVAQKLSQEKFAKRNAKGFKFNKKYLNIAVGLIVFAAIAYSLMFVFRPAAPENTGNQLASQIRNPVSAKGMVITSGTYKTLVEAERFQKDLSEKLGVPLKILQDGKYFTIQIGPSYESQEDAMIVFDELSRYSIANLSLRAA